MLYIVCIHVIMYTYIIHNTLYIQSTILVRIINGSECSDIPNGTGKWGQLSLSQAAGTLPGLHHEHGRKEPLGARVESWPSPSPSVPGICKLQENTAWSLAGPCLAGTRSWDMKLLNSSEAWRFTVFWRVCMVNYLWLERSLPAKYQISVLKLKALESSLRKYQRYCYQNFKFWKNNIFTGFLI